MTVSIEHLWTDPAACDGECRRCARSLRLAHLSMILGGAPYEMFTLWHCPACLEERNNARTSR